MAGATVTYTAQHNWVEEESVIGGFRNLLKVAKWVRVMDPNRNAFDLDGSPFSTRNTG